MDAVIHDKTNQVFLLAANGVEARLEYHRQGDSIDFNRTFVPPELRGQGLAEKLVRHGLAWARKQGLDIHASCWYVQKFL
ncbi:GNAT family N-acetyltransferase [Shewanella litorisediminis]|uniref:N-acetyltransferase n=1 Tax=Shewanella litorisediminis TaxID=1173586 RepID=A0ABX7G3L9_9GAMM|nr:GNAT family N-acetyltransferase [Shewanella litorisediminis]MCL2919461.1 N-acetyltransferase [Shewanella litorisediminis]QRH01929.1 N-acetyltransferase [Shewanella litorisediminis]